MHILSLTGLLALEQVKPIKEEVSFVVAILLYRTLMSSRRHQFVDSSVPLSDFHFDLDK